MQVHKQSLLGRLISKQNTERAMWRATETSDLNILLLEIMNIGDLIESDRSNEDKTAGVKRALHRMGQIDETEQASIFIKGE